MGSGHILAYLFDVLMQIYRSAGYTDRDAAASIVEHNLYGLDIDDRAAQMAYFVVMMKGCHYDSRFVRRHLNPHVYAIQESGELTTNALGRLGKQESTARALLDGFKNAKEYGSILQPKVTLAELDALQEQLREVDGASDMGSLTDQLVAGQIVNVLYPLIEQARMLVQKYDVVVTNPPYMGASNMNPRLNDFIKNHYPDYKSDFFSAFIVRGSEMTKPEGYCGYFTPYVWMFIQSYEKLREYLYTNATIETLIQFEYSAFEEATVPVCTFAFKNSHVSKKGCYLRLVDFRGGMEVQRQKTLEAIANHNCGFYYEQNTDNFSKIPGSPVAYWVSNSIYDAFESGIPLKNFADLRQGMSTANNDLFLRLWFEVSEDNISYHSETTQQAIESKKKWFPHTKGGGARKWYGNNDYIVNWYNDGEEIRNYPGSAPRSTQYYFREGLSWSTLSSGFISFRYEPKGFTMNTKGSICYLKKADLQNYICGLLNSKPTMSFLELLAPTLDYSQGPVGKVPVLLDAENKKKVELGTLENIKLSKEDWDSFETSWDYKKHPLLRNVSTISEAFTQWQTECDDRFNKLKANEEELNRIFIDIYGLQDELTPEVEDKDVTVRKADLGRDVRSFISYAVGCMFGRYSPTFDGLAYAGGTWDDSKYNIYKPDADGIIPICDDEYFEDDMVGRFVEFVRVVYGDSSLEDNLRFIANALGGKGQPKEVIRNYFLNDFYADHCKIYQKRPIYWLFDSGKKNGFKCLIYLHRYQPDTIARIRTDYVHEQQARYRTAIEGLEKQVAAATSTSERVKLTKQLNKVQAQDAELHQYEEKVHALADQMIKIDLDDGVKHNYEIFKDMLAKIK